MRKNNRYSRSPGRLREGFDDNLEPLSPLDLARVKKFSDLTLQMSKTAFGGRLVGEAVDVLVEMTQDKKTFVVMTISGAMTVAKMGLLICEMIERGMIHAIVATGALMAHGLVEATGLTHFKVPHNMTDDQLYLAGYDRVYDTVELENNLDDIEAIVFETLETIPKDIVLSSRLLNEKIGEYLYKKTKGRGILRSAYKMGVPVYVPALTDSELGLDVGLYNRLKVKQGKPVRDYNPFLDLEHYTLLVQKQKKLGIFTIGGGVPRNWAQQVGPYIDLVNGKEEERGLKAVDPKDVPVMFNYGIRICPEPVHWGGLSGCTYSEGVSWGKFVPEKMGGRFAEVPADATLVWPLILKAAMEKLGKKKAVKSIFAGKRAVNKIAKAVDKMYSSGNS